jgi:hypothetical protein
VRYKVVVNGDGAPLTEYVIADSIDVAEAVVRDMLHENGQRFTSTSTSVDTEDNNDEHEGRHFLG